MRVLVTRPAGSGQRTGEKLRERGHEAVLMPLTEAVHDGPAARAALIETSGAIVVTSAEAIRALKALDTDLMPHLDRPVFAVGRATADEAAEVGFTNIHHADGDGARLAELIASRPNLLGNEPLTYLAGNPRAAGLEAALLAAGVPINTFECYRMDTLAPSDEELSRHLRDDPVDGVLFYSRHNAELFFALDFVRHNLDLLKNTRLICLSATIATIVPQALRSNIGIAAMPDEESLLQRLDVAS